MAIHARPVALTLVVFAACKGSHRDRSSAESSSSPPPAPADAAAADADLEACRAAAAVMPSLPAPQRAQALLDACRPCGDWTPLLTWNTLQVEGGPTHAAIERAMIACNAYCGAGARQRFLDTLDGARGQSTRQPWRLLGEACGPAVSAVPDARFMSAPYFALDRIARALGDAAMPAAITVPLPAVSSSGIGLELPSASPSSPDAGPGAITIDASHILLGSLPSARLSATGLVVAGDYPGAAIEPRALGAALAAPGVAGQPIALLAPHALRATRVAEVIATVIAAAPGQALRLAVALPGPGGWSVPGTVPISLAVGPARRVHPRPAEPGMKLVLGVTADDAVQAVRTASPADLERAVTIAVGDEATTAGLATLLAALAARGVTAASVVTQTRNPPATKLPAAPTP